MQHFPVLIVYWNSTSIILYLSQRRMTYIRFPNHTYAIVEGNFIVNHTVYLILKNTFFCMRLNISLMIDLVFHPSVAHDKIWSTCTMHQSLLLANLDYEKYMLLPTKDFPHFLNEALLTFGIPLIIPATRLSA